MPESPAVLPPIEPQIVPLWPDGSPSNPADDPRPTLEIYHTFDPARPANATIVILPGGGFRLLSPFEKVMAEYFRALGYTAVVVNYRVMPHQYPAALADALRAMRLVRTHATEWGIPAQRLALLGASAGGHLAALVCTHDGSQLVRDDDLAGKIPVRPDRLVLLYPVISAVAPYRYLPVDDWLGPLAGELRAEITPERHVDSRVPPTIIFHALDDAVVAVDNSIDFAQACRAAGVPVQLHLFPRGGHGRAFAYDAEISPRWRALLQDWLARWLTAPGSFAPEPTRASK